jgi:hypothetical protein
MDLTLAKRSLGFVSLGLGLAAVASPRRLGRWLGVEAEPEAISAFGARELASGAGLLSPVKPGPWFWTRVIGDIMDMGALAGAIKSDNPQRHVARGVALLLVGIAVLDVALALQATVNRHDNEAAAT